MGAKSQGDVPDQHTALLCTIVCIKQMKQTLVQVLLIRGVPHLRVRHANSTAPDVEPQWGASLLMRWAVPRDTQRFGSLHVFS
jgi:hypothetical protein